jgi:glycosyltransferase involved in cell wall biosynthesis
MKKTIVIFLNARPKSGGAFSYSQSMLEALSALPANRYQKLVCYTHDVWIKHIRNFPGFSFFLNLGLSRLVATKRIAGYLPMSWWRAVSPIFHPPTKLLLQKKCNLWLFPAQETWTYLLPAPSLGTIFDLMHRYERRFAESSGFGLFRCRERHYMNICKWSRGIFVDSEVGKQHVMESYGLNPNRIHVLPFVPRTNILKIPNPHVFSDRYALPEKFFFYPAQFWEHKNHKALVAAAALLKHDIPDLNLVFVGSKKNGYRSTVKLVRHLGLSSNIHFVGYVPDPDMPEFYRRARALLMPTFYGPTNIPPLEAMALGCPVAASKIYGMPEQLADAALFFDPRSIEDIAQTMKTLWNDDNLCTELSQRGAARSLRWNQSHFNQRLGDIIEKVVEEQRNTP